MKTLILLISCFILIFIISCNKGFVSFSNIFVVDTMMSLKIGNLNRKKALSLKNFVIKEINRLDKVFNVHNPNSEISRLNSKAFNNFIQLSPDLLSVLKKAIYYARLTSGAFDPSILPLKQLWDFRNRSINLPIPSPSSIQRILKRVNYKYIVVSGNRVKFTHKNVALDLGGIAKGYIIDRVGSLLKQNGVRNALINIGGDVLAFGKNNKRKWRVGIQHPRKSVKLIKIINLSDASVVTSGDYERYFIKNQTRYHHILDPKTGMPANKCISVTVISNTAMDADALSTSIFVLGPLKGLKLINTLSNTEAFVAFLKHGKIKILYSNNFHKYTN